MATAVANSQDLPYSKPVALSLLLHLALAGTVVVSAYLHLRGDQWSGVGDNLGQSINVKWWPAPAYPCRSHRLWTPIRSIPTTAFTKPRPSPKRPRRPQDAIPLPAPEKVKTKPQPETREQVREALGNQRPRS